VVRLNRLVRFAINDTPDVTPASRNGYSAAPCMADWASRHYEALVVCKGPVHPVFSYLIDIKAVDKAVREILIPAIQQASFGTNQTRPHPAVIVRGCWPALNERLGGLLLSVRWFLNPTFSVEVSMPTDVPAAPTTALLRQKFEFAASHRLHVPSLSYEENLRLFGKCTWKNGHGHNYHVEPCIAITLDNSNSHALTLARLEEIVDEVLIKPFDHKNLNLDTDQFADGKGLNPSVENIAKVFFGILAPRISRDIPDATLREITVWESDRTSSTFPG
jgi:6-pyruvoyltetrahydropterin/6-carboxytetrahydropterin synthase